MRPWYIPALVAAHALFPGCGDNLKGYSCEGLTEESLFATEIGCYEDFQALASAPLGASIPGARTTKTIVDRLDNNSLTFQNSRLFPTHYDFASEHLSGDGRPFVPSLPDFNRTEYSSSSRRFLLGSLTYYEGPQVFAYELAPYDTASAELIAGAYDRIAASTFFGKDLYFHPTSDDVARAAEDLPARVKIITTDELFDGIDFQALNPAESYGQLRFATREQVTDEALSFRDIAVLDEVPSDISAVQGIITGSFQTPLSHVNVLSRNRGTPNMALRGAFEDPELRKLEGKWVRLQVTPFDYSLQEVSQAEADEWWEENKPDPVAIPEMDLSVQTLTDIEDILPELSGQREELQSATRAFGGKASHYAALAQIESVNSPKAFAIPLFFYREFMENNGFDARIDAMLADSEFQNDPAVRRAQLEQLRADMLAAPVSAELEAAILAKLSSEYSGIRMRFRSSTNAEDLDGFTGAGLYSSKSGDPNDPTRPVLDALRTVWGSIWNYRAFEERSFRSIDHLAVGMAVLVHRSFPAEEINGVALTNNPYDTSANDPAFYINAQVGDFSVVQPPPGVTTEQVIYYFERPGQPTVYVGRSNLIPADQNVLSPTQLFALGQALSAIRSHFAESYARPGWWAMDVEFKFDGEPGQEPELFIKQARPFGQ